MLEYHTKLFIKRYSTDENPDDELYIPLLTGAQRVFGTNNLDSINVGIPDDANVDMVMMTIEQILRARHDIGPGDNDFRISDYSQFADLRRQATGIFTALIAGIAGISLIVGGIEYEYYACICN